jgi:hypothetical protein
MRRSAAPAIVHSRALDLSASIRRNSRNIALGEICRDLLIAAALTGWRERTASLPDIPPREGELRFARLRIPDATYKTCCARARNAVIGFPAHGAWRQLEAALAARDVPVGEAGRSGTIARWLRSAPRKQQQPNVFTLQICGSGGSRRQNSFPKQQIDHNPLGYVPGGFLRLGRSVSGIHSRRSTTHVLGGSCATLSYGGSCAP